MTHSRRAGCQGSKLPAAADLLKSALEQEAERVATLELHRRRALLASFESTQREAITRIARLVAQGIAAGLLADAQSDDRLAHVLHAIYLPRTP